MYVHMLIVINLTLKGGFGLLYHAARKINRKTINQILMIIFLVFNFLKSFKYLREIIRQKHIREKRPYKALRYGFL